MLEQIIDLIKEHTQISNCIITNELNLTNEIKIKIKELNKDDFFKLLNTNLSTTNCVCENDCDFQLKLKNLIKECK